MKIKDVAAHAIALDGEIQLFTIGASRREAIAMWFIHKMDIPEGDLAISTDTEVFELFNETHSGDRSIRCISVFVSEEIQF